MSEYKFAKQIGNRGFYAKIDFDVKVREVRDKDLIINYQAESKWALPCRMGIHLFYDYFFRIHQCGLEVTINEVHWMPVDTNNLIVLFVTNKALCEHFNIELKNLELDSLNGAVIFPDPRDC